MCCLFTTGALRHAGHLGAGGTVGAEEAEGATIAYSCGDLWQGAVLEDFIGMYIVRK